MTGPDTPSFKDPHDSSPNVSMGSKNTEVKREEKSCGLSQAVNGDPVLLPEFVVFFSFLQNQSPVELHPTPACLALPRGKTLVLFISELKLCLARC